VIAGHSVHKVEPRSLTRLGTDCGSITAFSVVMLVAIFVLLGMVVDGGTQVSAYQSAVVEAEQAARAGAGALSVDALRSGLVQLNDQQAVAAAEAFTEASGHPGTATVVGQTVTVYVNYRIPTSILGIIGITNLPVSASASAVDVYGVTPGS
jgi:hypothetical protein